MANFNSVQLGGTRVPPRNYPVAGVGDGGRISHGQRGEYTLLAAIALNDTIQLFDLPRGARILSGFVKSDDLDTGGVALRLNIGDAANPSRYFAANAISSTGGVDPIMAFTGIDFVTTGKTRVFATVSVAPTTSATTGTLVVVIRYTVEEPA